MRHQELNPKSGTDFPERVFRSRIRVHRHGGCKRREVREEEGHIRRYIISRAHVGSRW